MKFRELMLFPFATVALATVILIPILMPVGGGSTQIPDPVLLANLEATCGLWQESSYESVTNDAIFGEWTGLNLAHRGTMAQTTGLTTDQTTLRLELMIHCRQNPDETLADSVVDVWRERRQMEWYLDGLLER